MTNNPQPKLYVSIFHLMRAALGLAAVDGGFVIAVQIINFLAAYFGIRLPIHTSEFNPLAFFNQTNFLILMLGMLNLAVIIVRISGLARGIKYSPLLCYQLALRRWPSLILLYLVGSLLALAFAVPLMRVLNIFAIASLEQYAGILMFVFMILIPYAMFACIFVIDQHKNPIQAIVSTWNMSSKQISFALLLRLSVLYSLPSVVGSILIIKHIGQYAGLFNAVWFLFCHIITIIVYTGTLIKANVTSEDKKLTTIVA